MRRYQRLIAGSMLAVGCLLPMLPQRTAAQPAAPRRTPPTTSPSVRQAYRLKYYPPPGWIRHYLGDDRYKLDGNIWTVVSTEMDTYYHRPNCPNMMRQPNGIVLGFNTGEDAIEAGYNADPLCHPEEPVVMYEGPGAGGVGAIPGISNVAQTVTLSDGASTVTVPAGWMRVPSASRSLTLPTGQTLTMALDILVSPGAGKEKKGVVFAFMTIPPGVLPGNVSAETAVKPETLRTWIMQSGDINTNSPANRIQKITPARLGGLSGVAFSLNAGPAAPLGGRVVAAARGNKVYYMVNMAGGAPGANTVLQSFRPH
jgi:hypothetical protein